MHKTVTILVYQFPVLPPPCYIILFPKYQTHSPKYQIHNPCSQILSSHLPHLHPRQAQQCSLPKKRPPPLKKVTNCSILNKCCATSLSCKLEGLANIKIICAIYSIHLPSLGNISLIFPNFEKNRLEEIFQNTKLIFQLFKCF